MNQEVALYLTKGGPRFFYDVMCGRKVVEMRRRILNVFGEAE